MKKYIKQIESTSLNLAEVKLTYQTKIAPADRVKITSSDTVFQYLKTVYDPQTIEHTEGFYVLLLNRANQILGWHKLASGGISGCIVDIRLILQVAILSNASGIIISHNHPTGDTKPSDHDLSITRKVRDACKLIDITLLDHVIYTAGNYHSFSDDGQL